MEYQAPFEELSLPLRLLDFRPPVLIGAAVTCLSLPSSCPTINGLLCEGHRTLSLSLSLSPGGQTPLVSLIAVAQTTIQSIILVGRRGIEPHTRESSCASLALHMAVGMSQLANRLSGLYLALPECVIGRS